MYGLMEHSSVESIFFSVVTVILQSSEKYKKTETENALNVLIFISKLRFLDLYMYFIVFMLSIVRLFPLAISLSVPYWKIDGGRFVVNTNMLSNLRTRWETYVYKITQFDWLTAFQNSFSRKQPWHNIYSATKLWNTIPIQLKQSTSLKVFKKSYKNSLSDLKHLMMCIFFFYYSILYSSLHLSQLKKTFTFCKQLLGVQKQTTNIGVLLELGQVPLGIYAKKMSIKNWLRITNHNKANEIITKSYDHALAQNMSWPIEIKSALSNIGMMESFIKRR